jgi:hypothetical protein
MVIDYQSSSKKVPVSGNAKTQLLKVTLSSQKKADFGYSLVRIRDNAESILKPFLREAICCTWWYLSGKIRKILNSGTGHTRFSEGGNG